jgi:hypothetical protein
VYVRKINARFKEKAETLENLVPMLEIPEQTTAAHVNPWYEISSHDSVRHLA